MLPKPGENKINRKHMFWLNNQLSLYALLCKIVIRKTLNVLSFRKFFGSYFRALISHTGSQVRTISGITGFSESEEVPFQQAKSITKGTSNNQPGNIMRKIILRSQLEEEFKARVYSKNEESWLYL